MRTMRFAALAAGVLAVSAAPTVQAGETGTIQGQVIMPDGPPALQPINVNNDKAHCLMNGPLTPTEVLVDPKTKGVKNVVIWLRPDDTNRRTELPDERSRRP